MAKSIVVQMDAAEDVSVAVGVAAAVETEADVVDGIEMMADLILLPKQPKIVGTTQNPTVAGMTTSTILLIAIRVIESRQQIPVIARNVRAVVEAAEGAAVIAMKDNGTTKRPPTVTATMRGAIPTTIADVMTVHAMKRIARAEAKDLVEAATVAHVAKATDVMIAHPTASAVKVKIAVVVAEAIVMIARNVQDAVVVEAAVHADPMIRFRPFHGTVKCRLGTMRSRESFRRTSRATAVDQEAAHAADAVEEVQVPVEVATLAAEITQVLIAAGETAIAAEEATTLDLIEAEATILVPTEVVIRVPAEEIPAAETQAAIGARVARSLRYR